MKKLFYSLILVIYFIGFPLHASAFGTSISGKSSINGGEEFTLTFSVTNATNLMGVQAKLNYDTAKLSIVSSGGLNDYVVTVGTNVVADRATGKTGSFGFATIKFKAKSAFIIGENTTVSLSSVTGSDGGDITGTGSSLKVSMVAPKSTNNNLSNLTIDGKQISGFSASKTSYSITVENNITTVVIGATSADSKATISGTGTKNLKIYQNTFNIIVTAESGAKKTYSVAIARKDSDGRTSKANTNNQLKSLTIKNVDFTFNPTTYTYDLEVDNEVTKLDITATTESSSATVKITNPDPLVLGLNLIKIEVTAEDKSTQTYTLNVNRDNNIPTVTEDNIYQLIESITSDVVNINVYDEPLILNSELLALLFEHKKDLTITYYQNDKIIFKWEIKGNNNESDAFINTGLNFNSPAKNKIDQLTNYAYKLILNFEHNGSFPKNTTINIYVGSYFDDNTLLNLYYFNEDNEEIELIQEKLKVENGIVTISIEHASNYFLSQATFNIQTASLTETYLVYGVYIIIIIIESAFLFKFFLEKRSN